MSLSLNLFDNFNDNSENTVLWPSSYNASFATRAETGGEVVITLTTATPGSNYSGYKSGLVSLNNSYAQIEIPTMVSTTTNAQCFLKLSIDGSNALQIVKEAGTLYFQKVVATTTTSVGSVAYNASTHLWWRIREANGTTYWDTSTDGDAWTNGASAANPIAVDGLLPEFGAGTYQSEVLPGTAHFDNFNFSLSKPGNIGRYVVVGNGMSRSEIAS